MQIVLVLLVGIVAGIEGILDEFEFHQPIVACTLIGLVTNHLNEGLLLGGSLQLIALGWAKYWCCCCSGCMFGKCNFIYTDGSWVK